MPQIKAKQVDFTGLTGSGLDNSRFQFGNTSGVPGAGTRQLASPGNTLVGIRMNRAGTIKGASIQVDVIDATRTFDLDIRLNGTSVATLALPVSTLGAHSTALSVAVAAGDVITTFMVKTSGGGASTFNEEHAMVEVSY
jgi:hypothetical protein